MNFSERKLNDLSQGQKMLNLLALENSQTAMEMVNDIMMHLTNQLSGKTLADRFKQIDLIAKKDGKLTGKIKVALGYFISENFPDLEPDIAIETVTQLYKASSPTEKKDLIAQILAFVQERYLQSYQMAVELAKDKSESKIDGIKGATERSVKSTLENFFDDEGPSALANLRTEIAGKIWLLFGHNGMLLKTADLIEMVSPNNSSSIKQDLIYLSQLIDTASQYDRKIKSLIGRYSKAKLPLTFKKVKYYDAERSLYDYHLQAEAKPRENPLGNQILETLIKLNRTLTGGDANSPVEYQEWLKVLNFVRKILLESNFGFSKITEWQKPKENTHYKEFDKKSLIRRVTNDLKSLIGETDMYRDLLSLIEKMQVEAAEGDRYWLENANKKQKLRVCLSFNYQEENLKDFEMAFFSISSDESDTSRLPVRVFGANKTGQNQIVLRDSFSEHLSKINLALAFQFEEILEELKLSKNEKTLLLTEISKQLLNTLADQIKHSGKTDEIDFFDFSSDMDLDKLEGINESLRPKNSLGFPRTMPEASFIQTGRLLDHTINLPLENFPINPTKKDIVEQSKTGPEKVNVAHRNSYYLELIKKKPVSATEPIISFKQEILEEATTFWEKEYFKNFEAKAAKADLDFEDFENLFKNVRWAKLADLFNKSSQKEDIKKCLIHILNFNLECLEGFSHRVYCGGDRALLEKTEDLFKMAEIFKFGLDQKTHQIFQETVTGANLSVKFLGKQCNVETPGSERILFCLRKYISPVMHVNLRVKGYMEILDVFDDMLIYLQGHGKWTFAIGEMCGLTENALKDSIQMLEVDKRQRKKSIKKIKAVMSCMAFALEAQKKYKLKIPKKVLTKAQKLIGNTIADRAVANELFQRKKVYLNYEGGSYLRSGNNIAIEVNRDWKNPEFVSQMSNLSCYITLEKHINGDVDLPKSSLIDLLKKLKDEKMQKFWLTWFENNSGLIDQVQTERIQRSFSLKRSFEDFLMKLLQKTEESIPKIAFGGSSIIRNLGEVLTLLRSFGFIDKNHQAVQVKGFDQISCSQVDKLIVAYSEKIHRDKLYNTSNS